MNDTQRTAELLNHLGLGSEQIRVLGGGRLINVTCVGRDTADKWACTLQTIFTGYKVRVSKTFWDAADNKGTQMTPTKRNGFVISALAT